ncbi:MAG: hypothetical protein HY815_02895 [Candidatus Riflebacteria bacterium]|nr:hypothetical protein [Candidatus Riflebacteria bacterium]
MHTILPWVLMLVALAGSIRAEEDVPEELSTEPTWSVQTLDVTTSIPFAVLRLTGTEPPQIRRQLLGQATGELLLVCLSRSRLESQSSTHPSTRPHARTELATTLWDSRQRRFVGQLLVSPSAPVPSTTATRASTWPELLAVTVPAAPPGCGTFRALLRLGGRDHLASRGETVGPYRVDAVERQVESTLVIQDAPGSSQQSTGSTSAVPAGPLLWERTTSQEQVALSLPPSRETFHIQRSTMRAVLRDGPVLASLGQSLRLVTVLGPGRAVIQWRGDALEVSAGDRLGPWAVRGGSRTTHDQGAGRQLVELGVELIDLESSRAYTYKVRDHYRQETFEYREDPQLEELPVALTPQTDLPDDGL